MGLKFSVTSIVFLVLSVLYLGGEFAFNAMMLDVAGTISSTPQEIERVKDFGRFVSASGFALLVLGIFAHSNFWLVTWREWVAVSAVFFFCMIPAMFVLSGSSQVPVDGETAMTFLPLLGLFIAVMSGGRYRLYMILSIFLMSWPSMYAGQKILIEHYAVDKTTWQERADARNVLMLRASLEECTVDLGDKWLCGKGMLGADLRAVRAIITALWMHNPGAVVRDLGADKDKIIEKIALQGTWFSPQQMYTRYVQGTVEQYNKFQQEMTDKYYVPYKKVSDLYEAAADPVKLQREADMAAEEVEKEIDKGWAEYAEGVRRYKSAISRGKVEAVRAIAPAARLANRLCENRNDCPTPPDPTRAIIKAQKKARANFIKASGGYSPDIKTREEFLAHPITAEKVRDEVQDKLRAKTGDNTFTLPSEWVYDQAAFKGMIKNIMQEKAETLWQRRFRGKIKPGLSRDAFFAAGSKEQIPRLDEIIMTEDQFMKTQVLPRNHDFMNNVLQEMRAEAPHYANGQMHEQKGKDFIRAAYIPAVALVLSLVIVMLTLARGVAAGLAYMERREKFFPDTISPTSLRMGVMAALVLMLVVVPYIVPNDYTAASPYRKYLGFARDRNLFTASVLDWAIHMQPIIYLPGGAIRSLGDGK